MIKSIFTHWVGEGEQTKEVGGMSWMELNALIQETWALKPNQNSNYSVKTRWIDIV